MAPGHPTGIHFRQSRPARPAQAFQRPSDKTRPFKRRQTYRPSIHCFITTCLHRVDLPPCTMPSLTLSASVSGGHAEDIQRGDEGGSLSGADQQLMQLLA